MFASELSSTIMNEGEKAICINSNLSDFQYGGRYL